MKRTQKRILGRVELPGGQIGLIRDPTVMAFVMAQGREIRRLERELENLKRDKRLAPLIEVAH